MPRTSAVLRVVTAVPSIVRSYASKAGATVTLRGSDALKFVRYRDSELLDSNLVRMANHRLYLEGFSESARTALSDDPDLAVHAFKAVEPFLCTDLSVENISDIVGYFDTYTLMPTVTPEGEYTDGAEWAEYYVDEASLWECVRTAFCS